MNKIMHLNLVFTLILLGTAILISSKSVFADNKKPYIKNPTLQLLPKAEEIELALRSGPSHLREDATIYVFEKNGYTKVRSGKNGVTCMVNRDGAQSGGTALRPTCWDKEGSETIVPVMLRVGELLAKAKTAKEIEQDIASGFKSKRFISPRKSGIAYMLIGDLEYDYEVKSVHKTLFPGHYMIYAPGVSNADIGMAGKIGPSEYSLPFVYSGYSGGDKTAYIIVMATKETMHSH